MTNSKNGSDRAPTPPRDVAVYLDFENLYVSLKTTAKMDPNFDLLMEKCREFGRVILARAYADWSEFSRIFTSQMFACGFEPVYVPTRKIYDARTRSEARKNSVDIHITIDIIKSLFLHESVDTIILISGDRDYVPLINEIRQKGKDVYAIGVAGCTSSELSIAVDEMFYYHQLLDTEDKTERQVDVYNTLLRALRIARRRGYPSTLGILKPIMKELIGGFHERNYKNGRGQPFQKFKDLVAEAERRRLVKLVSSGATTEVFLWAEAPKGTVPSGRAQSARQAGSRGERERKDDRERKDEAVSARSSRSRRRSGSRRTADADRSDTDLRAEAEDDSAVSEISDDRAAPVTVEAPSEGLDSDAAMAADDRPGDDAPGDDMAAETAPEPAASADDEVEDEPVSATRLTLDDDTWNIVREALDTFGDRPPTPRKLVNQLKKARTAKAFGEVRPSDTDLDDLVQQCVDSGRLRRERKGFSTILKPVEADAEPSTEEDADSEAATEAATPQSG